MKHNDFLQHWKEHLLRKWMRLSELYLESKNNPTFKAWIKLVFWVLKIFISALLRRFFGMLIDSLPFGFFDNIDTLDIADDDFGDSDDFDDASL